MSKFFSVVGYLVTVAAAVFGILYLINKLTDKQIEDELDDIGDTGAEDEEFADTAKEADSAAEAAE